jgi:nitroreductase
MHIDNAIRTRKSVRRFRPDAISREVIEHIIDLAARAPSGNNVQPWHVHVITGMAKLELCSDILAAARDNASAHEPEYHYYPTEWFEPYKGRRRDTGFALYNKLGIGRDDRDARETQMLRNFQFFDAPVGLLISLDRRLNTGSYIDLGMFIQNILLAARGQDLHSCAQAAFANYHRVIRHHIPLAEQDILVCGIALGYEDSDAPENAMETPRAPISEFAAFHGFED